MIMINTIKNIDFLLCRSSFQSAGDCERKELFKVRTQDLGKATERNLDKGCLRVVRVAGCGRPHFLEDLNGVPREHLLPDGKADYAQRLERATANLAELFCVCVVHGSLQEWHELAVIWRKEASERCCHRGQSADGCFLDAQVRAPQRALEPKEESGCVFRGDVVVSLLREAYYASDCVYEDPRHRVLHACDDDLGNGISERCLYEWL